MSVSAAAMLAFQAAGAVLSGVGAHNQNKIIQAGQRAQDDQLATNLQLLRTQSADNSLAEIKQLRENIGSQIAIQAARGTASGAGSAFSLQESSIGKFGQDEQTRRINLLAKQASLRASNVTSAFSTLASETKLGQSVTQKIFNTVNTASIGTMFK